MKLFFTGYDSGRTGESIKPHSLASAAKDLGHDICFEGDQTYDAVICVDFHSNFLAPIKSSKKSGAVTVLVKQEPSVVFPQHTAANPKNVFDLVITRGNPDTTPIFNTYQTWEILEAEVAEPRLMRAAMIAADKWSMTPGELYSLRRGVAASDERVDLYGPGWSAANSHRLGRIIKELIITIRAGISPTLKNLAMALRPPINICGPVDSKPMTLSKYHASVVIENSREYMSEKLLDCILAGTIPIYVGPDVSRYSIPNSLVIEAGPALSEISAAVSEAMTWDREEFFNQSRDWLNSPGVREQWDFRSTNKRLVSHIVDFVGNESAERNPKI